MDALYLYLELVALATLAWLCRDKFKALVAKPLIESRSRKVRAPRRSRRLHRHRSSLAQ